MSDRIQVSVSGVPVAQIERFEDENYVFNFDYSWLMHSDRPILGQIYEDYRPAPMSHSGLPCWFAHLLPQGGLRRWVAHVAAIDADDDLEVLVALGHDLPGAVRVDILEASAGRPSLILARTREAEPSIEFQVASLAGNQMKLSIHNGERGLTVPLKGQGGNWIGKFADPAYRGLPRIEYATMSWAQASGIEVPATRLCNVTDIHGLPEDLKFHEPDVFVIQRFDRCETGRVHMEDFAQVLDRAPGPHIYNGRYEYIAAALMWLAPEELRRFIRQLVFCIAAGNTDAHLKNWTLSYPDGRHPRLSPAYDLISTVLFVPPLRDELALSLGGLRSFESLTLEAFHLMARVAQHDHREICAWVKEDLDRIAAAWNDNRGALPYTHGERQKLDKHLQRLALLRP